MIPYFRNNPRCFHNVVIALRLRPTSFTQLHYYSQTPFEFRARDDRLRYCKFRLLPEDRGPETGIPGEDDLRTPWFQEAKPGETLPPNYLKDEFRQRVTDGGATYHLEIQLHDWREGDDRAVVLNSSMPGTRSLIHGCRSPPCTSTQFTTPSLRPALLLPHDYPT